MKKINRAIINKLAVKNLIANKKSNFFVIASIILTTFMLTSVLCLAMSLMKSLEYQQMRMIGSVTHAALSLPSDKQVSQIKSLDYVEKVGAGYYVSKVKTDITNFQVDMVYFDENLYKYFHVPAWTDIVGSYPEKENEVMASRWVLEKLGVNNLKVGMEISLTYIINGSEITDTFILSGYYTSYEFTESSTMGVILVSEDFTQNFGKTYETDGSINILFKDKSNVATYIEKLIGELNLSEKQKLIASPVFEINHFEYITFYIALVIVGMLMVFTGYLLIYNVLYISVSKDVHFFGKLKTIGVLPSQINHMLKLQTLWLAFIGIPIGIILSLLLSFVIVPLFMKYSSMKTGAVISFSPIIFVGATLFTLLTVYLGTITPAKKAAKMSPIEATRYVDNIDVKIHRCLPKRRKILHMAYRNIFRFKKRTVIVVLSLFLSITFFQIITTVVSGMDIDKYTMSYIDSDFKLQNEAIITKGDKTQKFTPEIIEQLKNVHYLENIELNTLEDYYIDNYIPELYDAHFDWFIDEYKLNISKELIKDDCQGYIHGVSGTDLTNLLSYANIPIDKKSFDLEPYAFIMADKPELYKNIDTMEITLFPDEITVAVKIIGVVPRSYNYVGYGLAPTLIVSNIFLQQYINDPLIYTVLLDVTDDKDEEVLVMIKEMLNNDPNIWVASRVEGKSGMEDAKIILYITGGCISIILGLVGVLNFINVVTVSILTRKQEFAMLESVGMHRKQIRNMLLCEGGITAILILFLVYTIGNVFTLCIFNLFQMQVDYFTFSYPLIPLFTMGLLVVAVCILTPLLAYRSHTKGSIVERLRGME